ncbi:MAG: hypothetical protein WCF33_05785 [Pseudonocardiaceae bacterium]
MRSLVNVCLRQWFLRRRDCLLCRHYLGRRGHLLFRHYLGRRNHLGRRDCLLRRHYLGRWRTGRTVCTRLGRDARRGTFLQVDLAHGLVLLLA